MKNVKLSVSSLMTVLLYFTVGINFAYYPEYFLVRDMLLCILIVYCFFNIKLVFVARYQMMNLCASAFALCIIVISFINYEYTRKHINTMMIYCLSVMVVFYFMTIQVHHGRMRKILKIFLTLQTLVLLCNDYILITFPDLVNQNGQMYLIGNKFTVTYAHLAWITYYFAYIFFDKTRVALRKNILGIVILIYSGYIIWLVNCSSGLLAIVAMTCMILLIINNRFVIGTLKHFLVVLSISTAFVAINDFFLNLPFVQVIVRDVLGHSLTLSNRTYIYQKLPEILHGHWLIGFGFGTTYELGMRFGNFPNTQNGIMEWIWQCGLVGTVLLFCVICCAMKKIKREKSIYMVSSFLITLAFLASVEITLDLLFMTMLAFIYALAVHEEKRLEETSYEKSSIH